MSTSKGFLIFLASLLLSLPMASSWEFDRFNRACIRNHGCEGEMANIKTNVSCLSCNCLFMPCVCKGFRLNHWERKRDFNFWVTSDHMNCADFSEVAGSELINWLMPKTWKNLETAELGRIPDKHCSICSKFFNVSHSATKGLYIKIVPVNLPHILMLLKMHSYCSKIVNVRMCRQRDFLLCHMQVAEVDLSFRDKNRSLNQQRLKTTNNCHMDKTCIMLCNAENKTKGFIMI